MYKPLLKLDLQYFASTMTKAENLINPQVLADAVSGQLDKRIRFTPYADVDNTLVGQPGDTITRPKYAYIGPAADLTEGVPMDTTNLSMTTTTVTVKESGKAVEITEKAIITNVNGTIAEASKQIAMAIADKVDIDYAATLATTLLSFNGTPTSATAILDASDVFDLEDDENLTLFIHPKDYTKLVKSLFNVGGDVQNTAITKGQVAEVVGVSDIVKTKRVTEGTGYLQRPGAVEIIKKKDVQIKTDEDILKRTIVLAGNYHYSTNLKNDNGVVKITTT
ncbi:N4-gp56 family major capsid protein [Viridibacillus sp. FSL H7-0596]|uniref:N4-gp56 family major capsid protein n=1 Tax=Viridibacillus sp. FSL H7-0596 TaxID=1928923 RepID=UPI0009F8A8DF|nr:N4-gp56 family major capsid protein [Viridibacillus sp. FSL H7-0596]